jgi:hexosaminidase
MRCSPTLTCLKGTFILVLLNMAFISRSQELINIIPQPVEIIRPKTVAHFTITSGTTIVLNSNALENSAHFINDYLLQFYNFRLK